MNTAVKSLNNISNYIRIRDYYSYLYVQDEKTIRFLYLYSTDGDKIKGHKIGLFQDYNIIRPGGIACDIFSDYDDLWKYDHCGKLNLKR